jgi:hypothetical protein
MGISKRITCFHGFRRETCPLVESIPPISPLEGIFCVGISKLVALFSRTKRKMHFCRYELVNPKQYRVQENQSQTHAIDEH